MGKTSTVSVLIKLDDRLTKRLKTISQKMGVFGKKMSAAGRKMTMGVTLPLVGLGVAAIKTANDFNKSMGRVGTLLAKFGKGPALAAIDKLKKGVFELSKETGKSSKDIAQGLFWVISAFPPKTAEESINAMEKMRIVTKAAVAGSTDTSSALNLLSAVTKAYGDTSNQALQKVSDLAFKTNELGQTSFPDMANAITKVTALSAQLGIKQESLFGTFAALTGITGDANEVAVQMRGIFNGLLKPTKGMDAAIVHFQGSLRKTLKEDGILTMMQKLKEFTKGNEQAMAALFPRVRALLAAFALTGNQVEEFESKYKEMFTSMGATNLAFDIQQNHINRAGVAWNKFIATIQELASSFGEVLLPKFEKWVNKFSSFADALSKMTKKQKEMVLRIVSITAALGPLLIIIGKISVAIGFLAANPIALAIVALTLLGIAIASIVMQFHEAETAQEKLIRLNKELTGTYGDYRNALDEARKGVENLSKEEVGRMNRKILERQELFTQKVLEKQAFIKDPGLTQLKKLKKRDAESDIAFYKPIVDEIERKYGKNVPFSESFRYLDAKSKLGKARGTSEGFGTFKELNDDLNNFSDQVLQTRRIFFNFQQDRESRKANSLKEQNKRIFWADGKIKKNVLDSYISQGFGRNESIDALNAGVVPVLNKVLDEQKKVNDLLAEGNEIAKDGNDARQINVTGPLAILNESLFGRTAPFITPGA
jgi:TP901 family phage tail tape measure protein